MSAWPCDIACGDYRCAQGCIRNLNLRNPPTVHQPGFYPQPIFAAPIPKGCICPPRSEETCKRSDCGRRDLFAAAPADGVGQGPTTTTEVSQVPGSAPND